MELSNEAATEYSIVQLSTILVERGDDLLVTINSTRAALRRKNELERPYQIRRLAKLDAHALTEVIEQSLGSGHLNERMSHHAQPIV